MTLTYPILKRFFLFLTLIFTLKTSAASPSAFEDDTPVFGVASLERQASRILGTPLPSNITFTIYHALKADQLLSKMIQRENVSQTFLMPTQIFSAFTLFISLSEIAKQPFSNPNKVMVCKSVFKVLNAAFVLWDLTNNNGAFPSAPTYTGLSLTMLGWILLESYFPSRRT